MREEERGDPERVAASGLPRPRPWRSVGWTLLLLPFLVLPYRWLWLPCGLALTCLVVPVREAWRRRLERDHTLIVGAPLVLVLRTALDPGWWLPWLAVCGAAVLLIRGLRPRAPVVYAVVVAAWVAAVSLLARPLPRPGRTDVNVPPTAVLVCAGDSLTYPGADAWTYVARLRDRFGCTVINAGFPNDQSADLRERLDRDVLAADPTAVLVFIGGNDYLYGASRAQLTENLDAIVGRIRARGAAVVLVEIPSGVVWNPYAGVYRAVAARHGAVLVPDTSLRLWFMLELVAHRYLADPLTVDGIHFSPIGARRVADWLAPYAADALVSGARHARSAKPPGR